MGARQIAAVMPYAFSGTNARHVEMESVNIVWEYAFAGCPLEELYFDQGIYIHNTALEGCPRPISISCSLIKYYPDRYPYINKNNAEEFGVILEERNRI